MLDRRLPDYEPVGGNVLVITHRVNDQLNGIPLEHAQNTLVLLVVLTNLVDLGNVEPVILKEVGRPLRRKNPVTNPAKALSQWQHDFLVPFVNG